MVRMIVGDKDIKFLFDIGVEYLVVIIWVFFLFKKIFDIIGVIGVLIK